MVYNMPMAIGGCSDSYGSAAVDITQMMRAAQTEQVRIAEALSTQNIALQIDEAAADGIAETIDIAV